MFKSVMKKYGYYMLAFVLVLAVGITAGLNGGGSNPPVLEVPDDSQQTSTTPEEMLCPLDAPEVIKWYSDTELFYNSTLKQWESHRGVDLTSSVSTEVKSVLDGKVLDCSYSYEDGYCITIEHEGGLVTTYCSLSNSDGVKKGDTVSRGQKIGDISSSASNESEEGNHLCFMVKLNGEYVDPANYLTFENK